MLAQLFAGTAMKAAAAIIAALLLALAFVAWRADVHHDRAERMATALATEKAAHAVTRASLDQLEQSMAGYIADGERRTREAQKALVEQVRRSKALGDQIARIRSEPPTVAEIADCVSPGAVLAAEGL